MEDPSTSLRGEGSMSLYRRLWSGVVVVRNRVPTFIRSPPLTSVQLFAPAVATVSSAKGNQSHDLHCSHYGGKHDRDRRRQYAVALRSL